jgi:hypothetical protein
MQRMRNADLENRANPKGSSKFEEEEDVTPRFASC